MPKDEFQDILDDIVEQLGEVDDQLTDGGPHLASCQEIQCSQTWLSLVNALHRDAPFQQILRRYYANAVRLLRKRSCYARRNLPPEVTRRASAAPRARSRSLRRNRAKMVDSSSQSTESSSVDVADLPQEP